MQQGVERRRFGSMPDGTVVEAVTLAGGDTSATIITLGATVQAVRVPDRDGRVADVTLGHDDLAGYLAHRGYFGATIGRFANRIAGGTFPLDGRTYRVPANDGPNALHGGPDGFDRRVWDVIAVDAGPPASVTLRLVSPEGDQGFPGTLTAEVTFAVDAQGTLTQAIRATTDAPTIVGMTNHIFWNLAGEGSPGGALGHRLTIPADAFTPVDGTSIPTGEVRPVAGTSFDFRMPAVVADRVRDGQDEQLRIGRGFDHNWALGPAADLRVVARLEDPGSGRMLAVLSDHPGLQCYSGNFLDGSVIGKNGHLYRMGDAICLEPQRFPDTPNRPAFGSARLAPGEVYEHCMAFRFGV